MQAADGLIADGSIRSGKTVSLSLSFVLWGMARFNGQNFALCGKTIASLRRNVVGVLKQMLTARGYTAAERRGDNLLIVTRRDRDQLLLPVRRQGRGQPGPDPGHYTGGCAV